MATFRRAPAHKVRAAQFRQRGHKSGRSSRSQRSYMAITSSRVQSRSIMNGLAHWTLEGHSAALPGQCRPRHEVRHSAWRSGPVASLARRQPQDHAAVSSLPNTAQKTQLVDDLRLKPDVELHARSLFQFQAN
jgi:hypothetical protein